MSANEPKAQCPTCFGRGYVPQPRKGKGPSFYARNCWRCQGRGEIEESRLRKKEKA